MTPACECAALRQRVAELEGERDRLRAVLRAHERVRFYAVHFPTCASTAVFLTGAQCNCGLDEALAALERAP